MTNIPQKTCIKVKGLTLFTLLRVKEVKVLTLPHVSPFTLVDPRLSYVLLYYIKKIQSSFVNLKYPNLFLLEALLS